MDSESEQPFSALCLHWLYQGRCLKDPLLLCSPCYRHCTRSSWQKLKYSVKWRSSLNGSAGTPPVLSSHGHSMMVLWLVFFINAFDWQLLHSHGPIKDNRRGSGFWQETVLRSRTETSVWSFIAISSRHSFFFHYNRLFSLPAEYHKTLMSFRYGWKSLIPLVEIVTEFYAWWWTAHWKEQACTDHFSSLLASFCT